MVFIIAIAGGSGAGKTTLARRLMDRLPGRASLIGEDDYYLCRTTIRNFDPETHDFDAPSAKDHGLLIEHLRASRAGASFEKPIYAHGDHRRVSAECIEPCDYLIIEGLHVLNAAEMRALADLTIYIDADEGARFDRRLARDVSERNRCEQSVRRQFHNTVAPAHTAHVAPQKALADLVLVANGDLGTLETLIAQILDQVQARSRL